MDILQIITTITSVLGLGGCGFLYWRQEGQKRDLANQGSMIENNSRLLKEWENIAHQAQERELEFQELNTKLHDTVEQLYNQISEQRNKKEKLRETIAELLRERADDKAIIEVARNWKCNVRNCTKRQPPSPITMDNNE